MSQIINTLTFSTLTTDGNEDVVVEIGFLDHAYSCKYYMIDQVNGHINMIHNHKIELTEFTGRFIYFDLDDLETKMCRLADSQEDENDLPQGTSAQQTHQAQESDSNSGLQSIEDPTGMGFNSPNYSPIPPVRDAAPQRQSGSVPTSTPIPDRGLCPNTSDPTHNRGKVNSFRNPQETLKPQRKLSKEGKVKSSQGNQLKNQP